MREYLKELGERRESGKKFGEALGELIREASVGIGLALIRGVIEEEVESLCGVRYSRTEERQGSRYEKRSTVVGLSGQKVSLEVPRVRNKDSEVAEKGFGVKKSSVSRAAILATREAYESLQERVFHGKHYPVILIDGKHFQDEQLVAVMGVTKEGEKEFLGLSQGATENAVVVTELLENLQERGLSCNGPTLFVLDGAKALTAGVKRVFGNNALIQRCTLHKQRNIEGYLSKAQWKKVQPKLQGAYGESSYETAKKSLLELVFSLEKINPHAAKSLQEGLEETLTVTKLGLNGALKRSFSTTNLIESAFSVCERHTRRVTNWQDGDMRLRWVSAGLLDAEKRFRKVKGVDHMQSLLDALSAYHFENNKKAA